VSQLRVSHPEYAEQLADMRATLGEAAFEAAWADGRQLTLEQAIIDALEHDAVSLRTASATPARTAAQAPPDPAL